MELRSRQDFETQLILFVLSHSFALFGLDPVFLCCVYSITLLLVLQVDQTPLLFAALTLVTV